MDDPWDVKSVKQAGQYTSCMRLNGAPLLPPVLSKECRTEMQYYKLLAKEVEKRISILQPYLAENDIDSEDNTDALDIPESELTVDLPKDDDAIDLDVDINSAVAKQKHIDSAIPTGDQYDLSSPNVVTTTENISSNFVIDFSLSINQTGRNVLETVKRISPHRCIEVPERDYNCVKEKELLLEVETNDREKKQKINKALKDLPNFSTNENTEDLTDPFPDSGSSVEGLPSLGSKSFTGSLNNLHTETAKSVNISTLARQRSYTLLKPSPQLLAHLEVQSINTGVDMKCISMSESLSNLSTPNRKRRSWDLESAKVKWSSMALELKAKNLPSSTNTSGNKNSPKQVVKKTVQQIYSPPRAKSVIPDKKRRGSTPSRPPPTSEPIPKRGVSPLKNCPSNDTVVKGPASPKLANQLKEPSLISPTPKSHVVSDSEDPATKVRELYDKILKQQLVQMASLVEKQKREQLLLQQVFEEQNSLLFKQLKTIAPKSIVEAKEAWGDKSLEAEKGPVSLSQLINHKTPEQNNSTMSCTLTETNNYINKCDNVLKKSRDISNSIKKPRPPFQTCSKIQSPKMLPESNRTRSSSPLRNKQTSSPNQRNTSRRLNYDSSASEREVDPILTDRTNDTMADLNVTFPTDISDCEPSNHNNTVQHSGNDVTVLHTSPFPPSRAIQSSTDSAINCMELSIQKSINNSSVCRPKSNTSYKSTATPKEREAASKIVAGARGFLVRRLMRTERVTATVQTIRDALLCALQLHQDREGIRGADVDLHRRLIQQITAACYSLHDTFIMSSPAERCAMLAADRARRRSLANRPPPKPTRQTDLMSQSHSGVFPARPKRVSASLMTQSTYESYSNEKARRARYMPSPRRRPWR